MQSNKTLTVEIKDLIWDHDPLGYVYGVMCFGEEIDFFGKPKKQLQFGFFNSIKNYGIGPGSVVTFESYNDKIGGTSIRVKDVQHKVILSQPKYCKYCGSAVEGEVPKCTSYDCSIKTTTPLYRLAACTNTSLDVKDIAKWFSSIPYDGKPLSCDSVITLMPIFSQLHVTSQLRPKIIKRFYGSEDQDRIQRFEHAMHKLLTEGLTFSQFWWICTIPSFTINDCVALSNIDPRLLTSASIDHLKELLGEVKADILIRCTSHWELYSKRLPLMEKQCQ